MRDCSNVEMRDRLPDLLHGQLSAAREAAVRAHLATCAECRAELALLTLARAASPAPVPDVSRIAGAIPAYRRPSTFVRFGGSPALRAAAVILFVGGAALVARGRLSDDITPRDSVALGVAPAAGEIGIGDTFQDLSDSDLKALADELGNLPAMMLEEPAEVAVPMTELEGG
jgi:anti-sigma factor RsiW